MKKKLWGIVFCLCLFAALLPATAAAAEGEEKVWELWGGIDWNFTVTDEAAGTGTLTIRTTSVPKEERAINPLTGEPYEDGYWREAVQYNDQGGAEAIIAPPYPMSKVTKLIIEEGVTHIGSFAAKGMPIQDEVVIPSTVTYIGQEAFQGSTIRTLTFAENSQLKCIAPGAFKSLNITAVSLPEGLECIHCWTFDGCNSLTEVTIPSSVTLMADWTHVEYWGLENYHPSFPKGNSGARQIFGKTNVKKVIFGSDSAKNAFISTAAQSVSTFQAHIGSTFYCSLQDALNAAAGDVVLAANVTIGTGETVVIPSGVSLVIPEGLTLTNKGTLVNLGMIDGKGKLTNSGTVSSVSKESISEIVYPRKDNKILLCYTISYVLNGGSVASSNPTYYIVGTGTLADLHSPTLDGFVFMGWYTDSTYTTKFDFTAPITGPVTLYAKFAHYAGDIADLVQKIDNTKAELQAKINTKADAAAVNAALSELQSAIDALEAVKDDYVTADAALKAELETKITNARTAAVSAAEALVSSAKADLQAKIDTKADAAAVNAAIAKLQNAITVLEKAKDDYAAADKALKAELETKITDARTAAVSAAEALVSSAKADLQAKIDTKADAAAVNAAIAKLQNAITVLEKAKDDYITADAALKAELEAAIAKAKQEAIDAAKGHIPHIGENGNWWIGESDTGVSASGIPGEPGKDGVTPQLRINSENIWEVSYDGGKTWESMGISAVGASGANGQNGAPGQDGSDGVGIANIEKTSSNGNVDIYTITLTNGKTFPFTVTNGVDGKDGADGVDGADGKDGESVSVVVPTVIGSAALVSNIGLIAWILSKKKVPV